MVASHPPRFRRRIIGIGALSTVALVVIGAPLFIGSVESDLETRVPDELAEVGFTGMTASFSGQDGTLDCVAPLADPEAALAAAYDVWGVRSVELDRSCRISRAPVVGTTTTTMSTTAPPPAVGATDPDGAASPVAPSTTSPTAGFATIAEVLASDPDYSLLDVLTREAGVQAMLADSTGDPVTLFAPTNEAFDVLSADIVARLRSNPSLLARVLEHHMIDGSHLVAALSAGSHGTRAGDTVEVVAADETTDGRPTIDGATVVDADVEAGNGVVHAIDRVLIPVDIDLSPAATSASVTVRYDGSVVTLSGTVATDGERTELVDAATRAVGAEGVVDQLEIDLVTGAESDAVAAIAGLVGLIRDRLTDGTISDDGADLTISGVATSDESLAALAAAAGAVDATVDLSVEPPAEAPVDDPSVLEDDLNAIVSDSPVVFEPRSAELDATADAVLDRVAARLGSLDDVVLVVEGHTDSDGDEATNLELSLSRADAVRAALIERGLSPDTVEARGLGTEQPVLVDGAEDKDASRRVVFRVIAGDA